MTKRRREKVNWGAAIGAVVIFLALASGSPSEPSR